MGQHAPSDIYDCDACAAPLSYAIDEEGEALDGCGELVCLNCALAYMVDMKTGGLVRAPKLLEATRTTCPRCEDFADDMRKVLNERCAPDEHHCSCVPHLRAEVERLTAERDMLKADLAAAAGELMVPIPEPGTDASRMLLANVLLRRERDSLRTTIESNAEVFRLAFDQERAENLLAMETLRAEATAEREAAAELRRRR